MALATCTAANEHAITTQASTGAERDEMLLYRAITRAKAGEADAIAFLYARFAENVNGYVRSILHDAHEAEDVTQQVFAKLIHSISKYEQRSVPFLAWILRVSRNLAFDQIRSQRSVPVEDVRAGGRELDLDERAGSERLAGLREALATLPPAQREVLILRHLAGLSPREIAARTGRSEGSIHALHHRSRRAVQAELRGLGLAPAVLTGARGNGVLAGAEPTYT
jgi:RNA polymerase sigma-70 factor, ECF subfamily